MDGYDKDTEMAALVLIDGEILLRVRTTWMVMTKIDSSTCPDRWSNSIKSKDNFDGYAKDKKATPVPIESEILPRVRKSWIVTKTII